MMSFLPSLQRPMTPVWTRVVINSCKTVCHCGAKTTLGVLVMKHAVSQLRGKPTAPAVKDDRSSVMVEPRDMLDLVALQTPGT